MPDGVPYVFCRYSFSTGGRPLSGSEQLAALKKVRGTIVPHRKSDSAEGEGDTFAMRPKELAVGEETFLTWDVGFDVRQRKSAKYNRDVDELSVHVLADEGVRFTSFVAIPRLGVMAVNDRLSGVHIGAKAGISRLKSVFKHGLPDVDVDIVLAASQADARRAISDWSLSKFSFTVRPFNPHPREPGRKLSEFFERDGIGRLTGTATPLAGREMKMAPDGYIEETLGLAESGYGQYGIEGTTSEGRSASLAKPQFSLERRVNEKRQSEPHLLRVYVDDEESEAHEHLEAARALIEFYG